jgi:hypothetical protein
MFHLYGKVATTAARNAVRAWPAALSLVVYALILYPVSLVAQSMGMVGGFLLGLVGAACWSSYIELISQAVAGAAIHVRWAEFKATFGARFWDVISVMFAFWIIGYAVRAVVGAVGQGAPQVNPAAVSAIFGIAMAFFFNAVPELLYQGNTRSFSLLMSSAKFMLANPIAWLLPNLVFAAAALAAGGGLHFERPAEVLLAFGNTFSSPLGVLGLFAGLPLWSLPLALFAVHYVMIFRGILFRELSGSGGNTRLRAFQAHMRR